MTVKAKTKPADQQPFSADVARLLEIVAHALYTNHDVFLRELISNAADACDRLRYEAIQNPDLTKDNAAFRIHIYKDTGTRTLTVVDNGIGMDKRELTDNLGTIAKSGTAKLMEQMKDAKDPLKLIGQFGVGFYASYMVADFVTVVSRKAGSKTTWAWESDGRSGFTVREPTPEEKALLDGERGTAVILNIKDEGADFLVDEKIKQTVQTYSDHVDVKIFLNKPEDTDGGEGQPANTATALWARPKNEITKEQYTEFYKHITHGMDEPLMTSHWRAEGKIEFSALLFVPTMRPWDLYDPSRKNAVRLYVRRVFISDSIDGLMYPWLRFVRGVIDSADLPLNISRESLQHNPVIAKIRSSVTKRILSDLDKLSREDEPGFLTFWAQFGPAVKEGLYDAPEHREAIFKICRFLSTHDPEKFTSLDEYVERMQDGQKEIYYMSGENAAALRNSPQLEGFKAKGYEVLLLTDTIDDFWLQQVGDYKGHAFKSVTQGDIDFDQDEEPEEDKPDILGKLKDILKDEIEDVKASRRLTDSPVCLVAPEQGVDMNMERVLKIHQQYNPVSKPVLEVNLKHPLLEKLQDLAPSLEGGDLWFEDAAHLLLDQARIIQGEPVRDTAGFAKRMSDFMSRAL